MWCTSSLKRLTDQQDVHIHKITTPIQKKNKHNITRFDWAIERRMYLEWEMFRKGFTSLPIDTKYVYYCSIIVQVCGV